MAYFVEQNGKLVLSEEIATELKSIAESKKKLETREKALKKGILGEMQDKTHETTNYGVCQIQVTASYIDLVFDEDKFAQEQPELYEKYRKAKYHGSTYKIVLVKEKK